MPKVFVEENGVYKIDLSLATTAVGDLKNKYQSIGNFLSDVDFIAETDTEFFMIEYKNTEVENAQNPDAFAEKIQNGKLYDDILKKYYGSTFYLLACKKDKPINYIFVIESKFVDSIWRKTACASIKRRLPFVLQELPEIKSKLINNFEVLSISEWNEQYAMFPLIKV